MNPKPLTANRERVLPLLAVVFTENTVLAAETPFPSTAPQSLSFTNVMQWSMGLVIVLIAIFICAWLLRKMTGFSSLAGGKLRVLGGISLGGREKVVLLQVEEKQLLLGVAPGRVQILCVLDKSNSISVESDLPESLQPLSFVDRLADAVQHRRHDKS